MLKICPKTEHQHTLLWIHGLTQVPEDHQHLFNAPFFQNFKIVIPKAPIRYSTDKGKETTSWYDIKFRN